MRARACASLVAILAVHGGCSFNFDSQSEIKDRRILAIQVDPPELVRGQPLPASIAVRALVVDPGIADAQVDYVWRSCVVGATTGGSGGGGDGGGNAADSSSTQTRCDASDPATLLASGTSAMSDLSVNAPIPDQVAAVLVSDGSAVPPQIKIELDVDSPHGELYAIKMVTASNPLPSEQAVNTNPQLSSLSFDGAAWSEGTPLSLAYNTCADTEKTTIDDAATGKRVSVCTHQIDPVFDDAESQFYLNQLADGSYENERERLQFFWFADVGSFNRDTTSQPRPGLAADPNGLATKWQEPVSQQSPMTLWVVVRDGRGGESWASRQVVFQ